MRDWRGDVLHAASEGKVIAAGDPGLIEQAVTILG
jgi:hypothetical protein